MRFAVFCDSAPSVRTVRCRTVARAGRGRHGFEAHGRRHPQDTRGDGLDGEAPRFHLHFTPTSASWLNMVERFFAVITMRRIRRGSYASLGDLETAI
jgi:hypothetical protein